MHNVTDVLTRVESGDSHASEQLLPLVYDELRKLAAARLARERPGQTLQPTALVHEAYVRLVGSGDSVPTWSNRSHFFAAAAEAMRRILVERARQKGRGKRGGNLRRVDLALADVAAEHDHGNILALDEALTQFAQLHPEKAELIKLRYFGGLTGDEAARVLGISPSTADRHWTFARAWLFRQLSSRASS